MMTALIGLIRKEFIQIFRDRNMLRIIFVVPLVQLILFGYVTNTEVRLLDLDVYDFDQSQQSRELIASTRADDYFSTSVRSDNIFEMEDRFKRGTAEMALVIDQEFGRLLEEGKAVTVGLVLDGSNASTAAIGSGYLGRIARDFSQRQLNFRPQLDIKSNVLYNPEAKSVFYMVPGIAAVLLTMITVMVTSMGIVREREMGTLEQLLVTPISTRTLLLGKIIPFGILSLAELSAVLALGTWWFEIPFVGSASLLFGLSTLFLFTTLGVGLFFSTVTSTQQQAMFFAWFFSVFAILTSGFFTPISNMPEWMQWITYLNPMRYFMFIVRGIMMKGSGFYDLLDNVVPLTIFGLAVFSLAAIRFARQTR